MASLDMAAFDAALKVHYTNDMIKRMTYEDHPFLALCPKMEQFGGKNLPIPIIYGNPQGRSALFATAQANKTPGKYKDFVLTRAKDYGLCSIDGETIDASKGNNNAFLEAITTEIDGTFSSVNNSLAGSLYRNGSGSIGRIDATTNTATTLCVLSNAEDIVRFEVGMKIVASVTDGGGAGVHVNGGAENVLTINKVDRMLGTITFSAAMNAFGGDPWLVNDYLFVQGDYDAKVKGLDAWIPESMPTATPFFGVDRSVDTRLAGLRKDVSNMPIEEGLIDGANLAMREGAKLSHYFLNYNRFAILEKSLGSKVHYVDVNTTVGVGFRGIQIATGKGPITVLADQDCPDTTAWGLTLSSWKIYSLGPCPKILNQDGNRMLRESALDGVEVRTGYYAQLGCNAPGWNIRLKLA